MQHRRIRTAIATVVAVITTSTAYAAGNHQICYQGPQYNSLPTMVVQCRSDFPGVTCSISMNAVSAPIYPPPAGASTVRAYQGAIGTSFTATISFSDGTQRACTTSLPGYGHEAGPAYAKAYGATVPVLTGYTTDQSGLLMTGIWSSRTQSPLRVQRNTVGVSRDFVLVGGGALGTNSPNGALISKMVPAGDLQKREFWVETQDAIVAEPHNNETYAIGMKIEGVSIFDLRDLVVWTSGNSGLQAVPNPSGQLSPPAGFGAILGGGAGTFAYYPYTGQFLTASSAIPAIYGFCWRGRWCSESSGATGWWAESKDHGVSVPGFVTPWISSMPTSIQVWTAGGLHTFNVVTYGRGVTSGVAAHPGIVVEGRSGEFALTGVGAAVDWRTFGSYGNLLWKVVPRADVAGVEASSKDHVYSSPATITGYVLGVKLVP
jgi:vibriolysin